MHVIAPSSERVTVTPAAVMTHLAAPSRGSEEISTWRVRMEPDTAGPEHVIDREQVWMLVGGSIEVTCADRSETVSSGQAVVLPAGATRRIRTRAESAEALVAMPVGGRAALPGSAEELRLPWAE